MMKDDLLSKKIILRNLQKSKVNQTRRGETYALRENRQEMGTIVILTGW